MRRYSFTALGSGILPTRPLAFFDENEIRAASEGTGISPDEIRSALNRMVTNADPTKPIAARLQITGPKGVGSITVDRAATSS